MTGMAIAAPNDAAADAGEQMARAGGSAVDAAIAAALVTAVNEVGLVSLSSGGFVTVQPADGSAYTVDGWMDMPGRGRATGGATWDVSTEYGGGVDITVGPGSVAVHGSLPAFGEAHAREGRLPWRDLLGPAIAVAREGFRLSAASRYYLDYVHDDIFGWDDVSRSVLHGHGGGVTTEPIVLPDLVGALEHVADVGPSALHRGGLADLVTDDVLERGGLLGPDDLAAYAAVVRPSLLTRAGPWALSTTPPPSVGGVCVAAMLRLLDGEPLEVERMVAVQRAVLGHRLDVLDHTDDVGRDAAELLALIDRDRIGFLESGSTVNVSTVDSEGVACAITFSSGYGSGMIAAGTGIWLNNCLGEQELNPRGLHGSAPGTRLLSNMAPTVARHDDGSTLAIGSPGADRISTAVTQVLAAFVEGATLAEAVRRPRVHVHRAGRRDEVVMTETELSMYYGGVGAAFIGADGQPAAAADPRRAGAVRLVPSSATTRP